MAAMFVNAALGAREARGERRIGENARQCGARSARGRPAVTQVRAEAAGRGDRVKLGSSEIEVGAVGIGAWSWGDAYWGWGRGGYGKTDVRDAFQSALELGMDFIDTAEIYGRGESERIIADFAHLPPRREQTPLKPVIATKFAAYPWRLTAKSVPRALKSSLRRLGQEKVPLYMQHWPGFLTAAFSNDAYLHGLAECHDSGLCDALGVSNFSAKRLRKAYETLSRKNAPLVTNQVQYSLAYRAPESNDVLETARELGVTIVAYSPLAQGLLTGKFHAVDNSGEAVAKPPGARKLVLRREVVSEAAPLIATMREVGAARGGKSCTQIALNWLLCQGVVPIVGVKNRAQVLEASGAMGWRLSDAELAELDRASKAMQKSITGFPLENA